ncbi:TPA: hypothetical protein DDW69_03065 [candidate division CPR2 bacterium]|uniref:Putative membrane protein n=1 Tax=candidate division CPR2 bacterium GW2011_GWC1_41_48 TaxID=1618344 RepID=A0A0G0W825_UNCC2|nr:MAG: putative membrane protein [candidate division CPR2 bacterium GW2011_GWC2_39_35]KKR28595.1 MAG: putative membrane protein [candidate division CPR2 bacterium GW2011_GWD1_39_7]KKR29226.1 MAG: putative membrane protein [candidate division CPR2 bacterium GW2011_GWD2_39_7]KKS09130.1 MAG: putative membrane protein [candidate division CPR2 bacterium GW2011_GWC1_41_48]OGB61289.1 MAG: hypothetical protein A2Y27_02845 [candidate division CPR2 bacterium GWD1_39_7]OGB70779.1 MAG: hypothetical prote
MNHKALEKSSFKLGKLLTYFFIACITVITAMLLYLSFFKPLEQDEGVFLTIANGIVEGKSPYQDYFDHKPPGIYFLLASAVYLSENTALMAKGILFFFNFISSFLIFKIANEYKKGSGFLASVLFLFSATFFETNHIIAEPFMVTFLLLAFLLMLEWTNKNERKYLVGSGLMVGLAVLFKQTAIVNLFIFIPFIYFAKKKISDLGYFIFGTIIVCFPFLIYLLSKKVVQEAINQIITVNFTSYPKENMSMVFNNLAPPFKKTLPIWILFLAFVFSKGKNIDQKKLLLIISALAPMPFLLVRHYPHYWLQIMPFIAIAAAISLDSLIGFKSSKTWLNLFRVAVLSIIALSFFTNFKWFYWMAKNVDQPKLKAEKEAAKMLKELPQKNILAENQFTGFYLLSEKEALTKYLYITEVNEKEAAEEKTIEILKNNKDTIIVWPKDLKYTYAKKLQNYIIQHYQPKKEFSQLGMIIYQN